MDMMATLIVIATLAFAGGLLYFMLKSSEPSADENVVKLLLTEAEVKKLTKAKLVELADSLDIFVDPKSTKKILVEEIEKHR